MEKASHGENSYFVQPLEVRFAADERQRFSSDVRQAIDESFLFADHSQSLTTVEPIELGPAIGRHETYDMLTLGIPYDRLHVDAVIDHDQDPCLRSLNVKLFREEWGHTAYTMIAAYESDDAVDDEDEIDTEEPAFYMTCPSDLRTGIREKIPLNYRTCRELLNHIVSLANPMASLTIEDRSLLESVEALMAVSTESIVGRDARYKFQQNEGETVEVRARDKALVYLLGEPRHTYHEATIKRIRSFGRAGSLATTLAMTASLDDVEATIAKEYLYLDNVADEILGRIDDVTNEHGLLSADTPTEFGKQLLDGVSLLRTAGVSREGVDRLES